MADVRPLGRVQYDNSGRVVIVTGGASGIGEAICRKFAQTGASAVCLDVREHSFHAETPNLDYLSCDVSRDADCQNAIEAVLDRYGAIDVLVNNAAIQPKESYYPIDALSSDIWDRMIAVNFTGYMRMAKYVLPQMKRQQSGVIVNMSSGQAHRTAREVGVYGPIKSGNVMQARQWGVEYAREGIRVVSVSPGAIDTPMVRASLEAQGGAASLANRHPIGRIGRAEEVAAAVLWLASEEASFVTATDLEVDGGLGAFGAFAEPFPMRDAT